MDALKWPLFFVWLCFKVVLTEASSWTIHLPSSVKGLTGSCVVIHCSFNYPDPQNKVNQFTGIWSDVTGLVIYHPVKSKILQQYQDRTELVGDVTNKNCSLKIDRLQPSDRGPFRFRIEMEGYEKYSYKENTVSITMVDKLNMAVSVKEEVIEGETVVASCSVSPACPTSLPDFSWSHSGEKNFRSLQFDYGQWKATATLTFRPTNADHEKPLQCNVTHSGSIQHGTSKPLKVKYAPVNVRVENKPDVKEGETVHLKCSSDAHPRASSYEWHNETGAQVHQGNRYTVPNVSRRMGALYCTAINEVGRGNSSLVKLSVLYAPEIKTNSSCSSDGGMVKCVCTVESKPPSMVHFVLSGRVLPGTKIEKRGSYTIGTVQAELGSSEFVHCLAYNTEGNANLTFSLPVNGKMQIIAISTGAGVGLVILLIAVVLVIKCKGKSRDTPPAPQTCAMKPKNAEAPQYAITKRKEMQYDVSQYPGIYDNDHIYGNMETAWDDAIYANV